MVKNFVMQIKNRTFFEEDPISLVAFLHKFRSACDTCGVFDVVEMFLFNQSLTDRDETAVSGLVALSHYVKVYQDGALMSFYGIVPLLGYCYDTDDKAAKREAEKCNFRTA